VRAVTDDDARTVHCATHGRAERALVCGHLFAQARTDDAAPMAYFLGEDDPGDAQATEATCAWCAQCDAVLQREDEWNDASEAFADIHVVCTDCLAALLARNVPGAQ
jgi:hypothetical protein